MKLWLDTGPFGGFFGTDKDGRRYSCVTVTTPTLFDLFGGRTIWGSTETYWRRVA